MYLAVQCDESAVKRGLSRYGNACRNMDQEQGGDKRAVGLWSSVARAESVRLKESEQVAILSAVKDLDGKASVYLFGSRVNDSKKGGDIDLLVLSDTITRDDKRTIKIKLNELLGEQKIDLVIAADDSDPFVKLALETGVKL